MCSGCSTPLDENTGPALKNAQQAAEQTGLDRRGFDPTLTQYLLPADNASDFGDAVVFLAVTCCP